MSWLKESPINRKDDRILVLRPKEGGARSSTGLLDNRLFTNEKNLHAVLDPITLLWKFKYDSGTLPVPMRGQWTSFGALYRWAEGYFSRRNVDIVEVID